jgi:hypothetical protein
MNPHDLLLEAASIFEERGATYGGADFLENNFQLAADLASFKLGIDLHPYHIATIMACVKEARIFASPDHKDSHLDAVNYQLFALIFSEDYVNRKRGQNDLNEAYQKKETRVAAVPASIGGLRMRKKPSPERKPLDELLNEADALLQRRPQTAAE